MKLQKDAANLIKYLCGAAEKADEDLALAYFRALYRDTFTRQKEAGRADGYVPGNFVLELKGENQDWLSGLFQGLAYGRELDFAKVVVGAQDFLCVWFVADIPKKIITAVNESKGAPSAIGKRLAKDFKSRKTELLKLAAYRLEPDYLPNKKSLFSDDPTHIIGSLDEFKRTLKSGNRERQRITLKNFQSILKRMTTFFDLDNPLLAVRAFYTIIFSWDEHAKVEISERKADAASVKGETVTGLRPDKREAFKEFVENHYVRDDRHPSKDVFFAHFDRALDAVDKQFRIKHGIFFTDLDLSRFAMWFVKRELGDIGKNHMVIDPACGSGNLVTNWRSPLELRHKVVSEIEPELLFAVERRMKGDEWHNGKFTVVPKVAEAKGLNFLDKSADDYLDILKSYLKEKGLKPDKPLAFLCNPPYRSDDDQAASAAPYKVHPSIVDLTNNDGSSERYCCFLAQMKLICQKAVSSGLPGNSLLLLFTKAAWLTDRPVFQKIRSEIFGSFEDVGGILVRSKDFFDVKGSFPIAFTIWKHAGDKKKLNASRPVEVRDLTWLRKKELKEVHWDSPGLYEKECEDILADKRSISVAFGVPRQNVKVWSGQVRKDIQRERRKDEKPDEPCGLPSGDPRHKRKKRLGEKDGKFVAFIDNNTPCRIKLNTGEKPWFRLNNQFMDCRKTRCLSGPPDNRGFCANDEKIAERLFVWFALGRTFASDGYPMWVDAMEMWGIEPTLEVKRIAYAIGFAENECVETVFPADNPAKGAPELTVNNPMSPLAKESFWNLHMKQVFSSGSSPAHNLVKTVNKVYSEWKKHFGERKEIHVTYKRPYFVGNGTLTLNAGLVQIKDYANELGNKELLTALSEVSMNLGKLRTLFHHKLMDKRELNYFGKMKTAPALVSTTPNKSSKSSFQEALDTRLALSSYIVNSLHDDPNFGRTKFAKVFYFVDQTSKLDLLTNYTREAAGPLDQRALYNRKIGIESEAERRGYFKAAKSSTEMIKYQPGKNLGSAVKTAVQKHLDADSKKQIDRLIDLLRPLDTDQTEIVSTLYACWNDLIAESSDSVEEEQIVKEFLQNWHEKKKRFKKERLIKALSWMKKNGLVPDGSGKRTRAKITRIDF